MTKKIDNARCQECKKEMKLSVYWKKFCSAKCRLIAWAKAQEK